MKKKIVSLAISLALLFSMVYVGLIGLTTTVSADPAVRTPIDPAVLEGYKRITVEDICAASSGYRIMDHDDDGDDNLLTVSDGWALDYHGSFGGKTYLDVDMNFNNSGSDAVTLTWQGNERYKNAFYLSMYGKQNFVLRHYNDTGTTSNTEPKNPVVLCQATPASFGVSPTEYFNVKLLTDVQKASADAATETVTWQCYVNNMYCGGGSITEVTHERKIFTLKQEAETNFLTMRVPKVLEEEFEGYEKISISDFQNGSGGTTAISAQPTGTVVTGDGLTKRFYNNSSVEGSNEYSLDKTYFDFDVKTVPNNFSVWTFSDLGIADQTLSGNFNWGDPKPYSSAGNSLDKTVFSTKVYFPTSPFGNFYIGCDTNWYGFIITANGSDKLNLNYNCKGTKKMHNSTGNTGSDKTSGTQIAILNSTTAKTTLRGNSDLILSLSVEYIEDDGINVTMKVGVFFNGVLYGYYNVKDVPKAELKKNASVYNAQNDLAIASDSTNPTMAYSPMIALYEKENWKSYLRIKLSSDFSNLLLDYIGDNSDTTTLGSYKLVAFGRKSTDEFFNIKVRADFKANASDASLRDAVIQLWINDRFATEVNLTGKDMRNGLWVRPDNEVLYFRESKDIKEELDGYRRVDMFDYNKAVDTDGVVNFSASDGATSYLTDFDKTYLDVDLNYGGETGIGAAVFQYLAYSKWTNSFYLGFKGSASQFTIAKYDHFHAVTYLANLNANDFGISPSAYFNVKLRADIETVSESEYSVTAQLWLNNKFACEITTNFVYGPDLEVPEGKENFATAQTGIGTAIKTVSKPVSVKSAVDTDTQLDGYKRIVADDFDTIGASVAVDGTAYPSALTDKYAGNTSDIAKSYIDVDIKTAQNGIGNPFMVWPSDKNTDITENKTETYFYGNGNQIRFYLSGNDLMMMKVRNGGNGGTETFADISESPCSSEFLNLKVKTTIYGANSMGIAVWVNGNFTKSVYVNNYDAATLANMTCLGFRGTNATTTYARTPLNNAKLLSLEYNLAHGNYLLKGWPTFRVNGTTMSSGEVLSTPGDYTVEYMLNGEPVASRTISLYKLGDTNLDGDAFVADAPVYKDAYTTVGMIKYGPVTRASVLAADLNNDGVLNDADSALFMAVKSDVSKVDTIVGSNYGDSIGFNYENGKNVMPIGGYYGPESSKITDEMFRALKDSGINMITYQPTKWGTGNYRDVLRLLALADKYGISVYITDPATNAITKDEDGDVTAQTTVSTSTELANAMAQYGIYDSFIGLEVIGEPKPSTGGDWSANNYKRYKYYDDLLGTLQDYANVSGGYVIQGAGAYEPGEYTILNEVEPDVDYLAFDSYLYLEETPLIKGYKRNAYFESLDTFRQKSISSSKPFWSYVSAGCDFRDDKSDGETGYYLTEADLLWNVNTSLAFGAKGITYFPLTQPYYFANVDSENNEYDYDRNGIIGADGEPNRYYEMVQRANTQISAIDDVLMNADSKGVIAVGNAATDITTAANQRSYSFGSIMPKTNGQYTDKLSNVTATTGAMVGAFDYHSSEAYYVVNYDTTAEATQTITLTFGSAQTVTVIKDGVETTYNSVPSLALTLDSGEGVLVVLQDYNDVVIDVDTGSFELSEAGTVNGVARAKAYEISGCGIYTVVYASGSTYNVVIYKIGDVTADGNIDIRDLVKIKRYYADPSNVTINKAGLNGLTNLTGSGTADKITSLVNLLLGR